MPAEGGLDDPLGAGDSFLGDQEHRPRRCVHGEDLHYAGREPALPAHGGAFVHPLLRAFCGEREGGGRGRGEGSAREVGGEARASEAWRRAAASVLLESGGA